jgi:GNAT superfamily N-acetyltransferase
MALAIGDFTPSDYKGVCRAYNSAWPDYAVTVEELKHDDRTITKNGFFLKRYVARGSENQVVAFGDILERVERYRPGKLHVEIEVDPRFRKTDVWDRLLERLEGVARQRNASALTARGCSRDRFGKPRLDQAGFKEMSRDIESRLDLRRLSRRGIEASIAGISNEGISYSTLGKEKSSNRNFAADLYTMENKGGHDVPATDRWRRMTLAEYIDLVHRSPANVEDAWQVAKQGDRYVGESFLLKGGNYPKFIGTGFTCVVPGFRGRGIAESLKLRALLWAKKHGVDIVKTWNDATNAPILKLNRKLGFRRYAVWFKLEKKL